MHFLIIGFTFFFLFNYSCGFCFSKWTANIIRNKSCLKPSYLSLSNEFKSSVDSISHADYLKNVANISPPKRLDALLSLLQLVGDEIVSPRRRATLNPFLIPISRRKADNSLLCFIRWPTQKESMDLQLVRTTPTGVVLVSMSTDHFVHRIAAEMDFYSYPSASKALELCNRDGKMYESGAYLPILKSGKFPTLTEDDLVLILDRFLLTKVGSFPDCYERLAQNYINKGDIVSGLVTCERAVSVFYGWGHPMTFHARILSSLPKYAKESKDVARAALSMPKWTLARTTTV